MVIKVVVTGASGLIGWHAWARLHASNCAAKFKNEPLPFDIVRLDRKGFNDDAILRASLTGADTVLHFAGVNRASSDDIVENANPEIAARLLEFCKAASTRPHIVFANSIHAESDTPYGRSKHKAATLLQELGGFTNLMLPHIFGEGAKPYYNNVTATLIHQIVNGEEAAVNPNGIVHLVYAGTAAQIAIDCGIAKKVGKVTPEAKSYTIPDLFDKLVGFHELYNANIIPKLNDPFEVALFNSYRMQTFPNLWPRTLALNSDNRGMLFEAVKGGSGGQTFFSTTNPGITRGDHFHLNKVERFLVVQGKAIIRLRKVGTKEVSAFEVSGDSPSIIDMPTLYTHSIENIGEKELLTLFWTNDIFDPKNPDTFADKVIA